MSDLIPRCSHGNVILGCPDDDCSEQNAYLAHHDQLLADLHARQQVEARRIVRQAMGLRGDDANNED